MKDTVNDFWMMIAEKQCAVIVMLTRCSEGQASKCSEYFPDVAGESIQVRTLSSAMAPRLVGPIFLTL